MKFLYRIGVVQVGNPRSRVRCAAQCGRGARSFPRSFGWLFSPGIDTGGGRIVDTEVDRHDAVRAPKG
jgi:hypothetical protein